MTSRASDAVIFLPICLETLLPLGLFLPLARECRLVKLLWKTVRSFLTMELPVDPLIPLLGIYPMNPETPIPKNMNIYIYIQHYLQRPKFGKRLKCPSLGEWIKKLWYIYTMEYHTATKKELPPFATAWMELEIGMLSEISQAVKDKYQFTAIPP